MSLSVRLILVFAVQALALVYMVAERQWTLATGTPVVLETEPVDPRSLFSGDYVRLNYRIGRLSLDKLGGDNTFRDHETVYVLLRRGAPFWEAVSIHQTPPASLPAPPPEYVMLRGEIQRTTASVWDGELRQTVPGPYVFVRYGIESYFVPEGEGRAIERPAPGEKVTIRVAVDARGRAGIQALLVNDRERYVERLF